MPNRISAKAAFISPVRTSSSVPPIAAGRPATMPDRMIIEMPLPRPRSVICSPSHIRNIVPATKVTVAMNTNCGPGAITTPWFWNATAAEAPCTAASSDRAVARVLSQLTSPGLAFLLDRGELRHDHRHHLDDDRRRDVGHHAEREDRQALQRAAREHVEDVQDRALLLLEEARQGDRVDARRRDERADAVDDQRAEQEEQALAQLREAGHLAEGGERGGAG